MVQHPVPLRHTINAVRFFIFRDHSLDAFPSLLLGKASMLPSNRTSRRTVPGHTSPPKSFIKNERNTTSVGSLDEDRKSGESGHKGDQVPELLLEYQISRRVNSIEYVSNPRSKIELQASSFKL